MQRFFVSGLGLTLLALSSHPSLAVVRRDDVPDFFYRKLADNRAFSPVGQVQVSYGGRFRALGTATLLSGGRLVSAAHVFDSAALADVQAARVKFGNKTVRIDLDRPGAINLHPRYNPVTLRNDISLIFLDQPISMRPAHVLTGPRVRLGTPITFVGYGNTGTGITGQSDWSTVKRGGENSLDRYYGGRRRFEIDFDSPYDVGLSSLGDFTPLALEGLLGSGDSGGSAWVKKPGGGWRLMGINSYGVHRRGQNGRDSEYGDVSGFIYVPPYERWINSLENPFGAPQSTAFSSLQAVPEPRTWLLALAGGVAIPFLRRRLASRRCSRLRA